MKIFNKIALIIIGALMTFSCSEDYITVIPVGTPLEANYYQNAEEAFAGLVAVYDNVGGAQGPYITKFIATNAASDDCYAGGGNSSDITELQVWSNYTLSPATGPQGSLWAKCYSGIFRANALLVKLPDIDMDAALKKRFIAEGKFLRAYFYFDLVRLFKNVPLFDKPVSAGDMYDVLQADPADVYEQIKQDLTDAIVDLPATVPVETEGGRATKAAAHALLGKVHIYLEEFAESASHLKEVNGTPGSVSQYGNQLQANFADLWLFDNKHNSEAIFSVDFTGTSNWGDWGCTGCTEGNWLNIMVNPRGYVVVDPTAPDYVSGWSFNVVTPELESTMQGDPRYSASIANLKAMEDAGKIKYEKGYQDTGFFLEKFTSRQTDVNVGGVTAGNFDQNLYDIRLADTYLLEAEALVRGNGDAARAQALLDAVRARVGLASTPVTFNAIKTERRFELVGEGHRWFDLVRWGDAPVALASRGFKAGKHEILPIPLLELENTKLEQNKEYGGTK